MIIGKIWDSEYPWDVRVEKVCHTLTEAGHEVHLVCRNRGRAPVREAHDRLIIHRMKPLPALFRALEGPLSFPAFINPRWYRLARRVFGERAVEIIICRDLPLAPLALAVGRALGCPVIVDLAEHYPGVLRDLYNRHDFRLVNLVVRNPWLAALVERWTLPRADGVWVVVEEMAERLATMGVPASRMSIVSNTPLPDRIPRLGAIPRSEDQTGALRLVYLGNVEWSRGLPTVLEALSLLPPNIRPTLDVFGDGSGLARARRSAESRGLQDRVTFHGRVSYETALESLPQFDVGLIPHHVTDQWEWTVQNKLFDYMAAGLPVLASAMRPARRIIETVGCGLVFSDRNAGECAARIVQLADPVLRSTLGTAGPQAVQGPYSWRHDARRLLTSLESALGAFGKSTPSQRKLDVTVSAQ